MPITCIVVGCGSRSNRDKVAMYSVPKVTNHRFLTIKNDLSRKRRALWLAAIKRDDLTDSKLKYQRVCSRHFITSKPASLEDETNPDWVPSQHMGHTAEIVQRSYEDVERKARLDKRKIKLSEDNKEIEEDHEETEGVEAVTLTPSTQTPRSLKIVKKKRKQDERLQPYQVR